MATVRLWEPCATSNATANITVQLSLPYFRDASELPGPLPSQDEIDQASAPPTHPNPLGRHFAVIKDMYLVKHGEFMFENEGHALLFIEKNLNIPAPRLYAMYRHQERLYIIMEYIPGVSLNEAWPSLSDSNKDSLAVQLRSIFDQRRALPSPGVHGGVNGDAFAHLYFISLKKKRSDQRSIRQRRGTRQGLSSPLTGS